MVGEESPTKYLPTMLSRSIAAVTLAIATSSLGLPSLLKKAGIALSDRDELLLQWALGASILFIGTLVVLLLSLKHYRRRRSFFG